MDEARAIVAFSALGQETRLATFRMLVKAGAEGITSGEIGERLGVRQNTDALFAATLKKGSVLT